MLNQKEILSTIEMIDQQHLDIRTITMGISLLSCCDPDPKRACEKIYDKITRYAEKLVKTGEDIEREFGIPIVNKRISVTPMALVAGASETEDCVPFALALDRAAQTCGINFIGGYSALVQKGMTEADEKLIRSIPEALARTELVCSSVNVGSTRAGINMDAVALMGRIVKDTAAATADRDGLGCAKLVVFCNAVEDNPFMAGAFHGVGEAEKVINVGVSGPGVVCTALKAVKGQPFDVVAETVKKTAFRVTRMGQLVAQEASRRLDTPFGIVDLSLAPTPAIGDSVARILEEMGLEVCGTHGTTAALALLNDAVKKGGVMASSSVGGLSGAFIPVSEDEGMIAAAEAGTLFLDKLGHDLRLLRGPGHDRRPRRHPGRDHLRHHCRRGGHRHGEQQDHRRPAAARPRQDRGGPDRDGRPPGQRPGDAGAPGVQRGLYRPGRPHPGAPPQPEELSQRAVRKGGLFCHTDGERRSDMPQLHVQQGSRLFAAYCPILGVLRRGMGRALPR